MVKNNEGKVASIFNVINDFTETKVVEKGDYDVSVQCPFHSDSSGDSMRIYPINNSAYCFGGCGSFEPVNIVMKQLGVPYKAAMEKLEIKYQLRPLTVEEEERIFRSRELQSYIEHTYSFLQSGHREKLYARGLTDAFIDSYKIGYHSQGMPESLNDTLHELGIYRKDGQDELVSDFIGKIIIPLYKDNDLVYVTAWNPDGEDSKYIYPTGLSKPLCGTTNEHSFLVEGVFDLLSMMQVGMSVVSTLGAKPTKHQLTELNSIRQLTIAFDGNEAGRLGAEAIAAELYPKAKIIDLEEGQDPNAIHVEFGNEVDFETYMLTEKESAIDLLDRKIAEVEKIESKREAAQAFSTTCIPLIVRLPEVEQDAALAEVGATVKKLGLTKASIKKEMKRATKANAPSAEKSGMAGLYEEILQDVSLYVDQTKDSYTQVPYGNGKKMIKVNGAEFKRHIRLKAHDYTEGSLISADTVSQLVNQLDAVAHNSGKPVKLANRIAWEGQDIVYDMTDDHWSSIRVNGNGWKVDESCPPLFKREEHQSPQVSPIRGGKLKSFFDLFSFTEEQELLLSVWLVYTLIPEVPKVILYVQAEKGSGKTDFTRTLRRLIDPSALSSLKEPNNEDRLVNQLYHHYIPLFYNINFMPHWFIRLCCMTATGESDERRRLFTDDGAFILSFTHPIILNAINRLAIEYPDFQDRTMLLKLARINEEDRIESAEYWAKFESMRSDVFGAMLDALSSAMNIKPTVKLEKKPRMADFATWGCAIAEALGYSQEDFLTAYYKNMESANEEMIYDHPVAHVMYEFMSDKSVWSGRASDLFEELKDVATDLNLDQKDRIWPKSGSALSKRLNEIKSNLSDVGIEVELPHQSGGKRIMTVTNSRGANVSSFSDQVEAGEI